jgi:hypothetical protein
VTLTARVFLCCLLVILTVRTAQSQDERPKTNTTIIVPGKVPPPSNETYTYFDPDPLLRSTLAGGVYHSDFFGFSYTLPPHFTAADVDFLKKSNKGETVRAEPAGSQLTAQTLRVLGPIVLLHAVPAVTTHREPTAMPYVSIQLNPNASDELTVESIERTLQLGESIRRTNGIHLLGGPVETSYGGSTFFRIDFNEGVAPATAWKTFFRTSIHGATLSVEFRANSKPEMDRLVATMESLQFDNSNADTPPRQP